jgi:hypothetical protein
MSETDDEQARQEQARRWREEIEAAKAGEERPPESPREFTDPRRREDRPLEPQEVDADDEA